MKEILFIIIVHNLERRNIVIEKDKKTIKVKVLKQLPSGDVMPSVMNTFCYEDGEFRAELVPYINEISKERDPMIRQISHKHRFLHLFTMSCMSDILFRTDDGQEFGINKVMDRLYN